jgi:7-carboxy-7-deazaguanine synthase
MQQSLIIKGLLTINEIFYSIQGESTYAGRPCVFVRLTACDLRCSWCDTSYAFYEGRKCTLDDVLQEVGRFDCPLVEVTGGEPLLQEDVYPLMDALLDRGRTVLLETGGHRSTARVPGPVVTILDVKCPGSGEAHRNDWSNIERLRPHDEVKFVLKDRADYEYARGVVAKHGLSGRVAAVLFSPVHGVMDSRELAAWILEDRLDVRLQLQAHKFIWGADVRGV